MDTLKNFSQYQLTHKEFENPFLTPERCSDNWKKVLVVDH
jgi:hypothetical protein